MFHSILVPLDGTRFAETALLIAASLARGRPGSLHLMLAHQVVPILAGMGEMPVVSMDVDNSLRAEERDYLTAAATNLALSGNGSVDYRQVEGPPGPAVVEEAARVGADLVVMTTHGRGAAGRLVHGGVADYLLRHLRIPVLLVHRDRSRIRLGEGETRGILVALDFSPGSEAILDPVEQLARITAAPVTLMHMVEEPMLQPCHSRQSAVEGAVGGPGITRAAAGRRLEIMAERLRNRGLRVGTRVAAGFDPAWALRDAMAESHYDLLAMTTHGRGGLRRLWLGSVAEELIRSVRKPMLVLRSPVAPNH